jgi:bifunctional non-homologous end joining protein LigD
VNGDDLRHDPLEGRKATLEMILAKSGPGIQFNEHMEGDGETVFRHACKLGPKAPFDASGPGLAPGLF